MYTGMGARVGRASGAFESSSSAGRGGRICTSPSGRAGFARGTARIAATAPLSQRSEAAGGGGGGAPPAPAPPGYALGYSLRFNGGDGPYLTWTPSAAGNRKKWTIAYWMKRAAMGATMHTIGVEKSGGSSHLNHYAHADNRLMLCEYSSGSFNYNLKTKQVFRDPST